MKFIRPPHRQSNIYRYVDFTSNGDIRPNVPVNLEFVKYIDNIYSPQKNYTDNPGKEEREYWAIIFRMLDEGSVYWCFNTQRERDAIYNFLLKNYVTELSYE